MSLTTSEMTPADFAAMAGNNDGMNGGLYWLILLFVFAFWGNGGGFGNNSGAAENYVLASDFATLQRQLDSATDRLAQQGNSIANGLCDGFYTQAQLVNGINANIADLNYNMAQNCNAINSSITNGFCTTNYNAATNTRDIIEAQNANTRAILDALNAQAIEAKDSKIAEQAQQLFACQLQASQQAQNAYLVNQLRPAPIPAYSVANPYVYSGCNC